MLLTDSEDSKAKVLYCEFRKELRSNSADLIRMKVQINGQTQAALESIPGDFDFVMRCVQ